MQEKLNQIDNILDEIQAERDIEKIYALVERAKTLLNTVEISYSL